MSMSRRLLGILSLALAVGLVPVLSSDAFAAETEAADDTEAQDLGDVQAKQIYYEPEPPDKPAMIGVKYRILLQDEDGGVFEVTDRHRFHSGDRIRFVFESNANAHLYIFHKGTGGYGVRLFPDKRINRGKNKIKKHTALTIPPASKKSGKGGAWWRFDEEPGKESLFLFVSRKPIDDLAALVPGEAGELDEGGWKSVKSLDDSQGEVQTKQIYYEPDPSGDEPSAGYIVGNSSILAHHIVLRHVR